jgi:hypothetical protein
LVSFGAQISDFSLVNITPPSFLALSNMIHYDKLLFLLTNVLVNVIGPFLAYLIIKTIFTYLFHIVFISLHQVFSYHAAEESVTMLHNKQKAICHTLTIALTIVILGSSCYSSSVSAFTLQPAIHHDKLFDKKQDSRSNSKDASNGGSSTGNSGRSSSSSSDKTVDHLQVSSGTGSSSSSSSSSRSTPDTKSSDSSNNLRNSDNNENNDQSTNDGSNTGTDNNLQAIDPAKPDEQEQQGAGENVPPTGTATPTPQTSCEQGSNCTDQQGLNDRDRSTTANTTSTTKQDNNNNNNTPFVLSLPFP